MSFRRAALAVVAIILAACSSDSTSTELDVDLLYNAFAAPNFASGGVFVLTGIEPTTGAPGQPLPSYDRTCAGGHATGTRLDTLFMNSDTTAILVKRHTHSLNDSLMSQFELRYAGLWIRLGYFESNPFGTYHPVVRALTSRVVPAPPPIEPFTGYYRVTHRDTIKAEESVPSLCPGTATQFRSAELTYVRR